MRHEIYTLISHAVEPVVYGSGAVTLVSAMTTVGFAAFREHEATYASFSIFVASFLTAIGTDFLKDVIDTKIKQIEKNNYDAESN